MDGGQIHPAGQKGRVHDPVKQSRKCLHDLVRGGRGAAQMLRSMGGFGDLAAIPVHGDLPAVCLPPSGICQIFPVIAHGQHHLVCDQTFFHQLQGQSVSHLPDHVPRLLEIVGRLEHLTGSHALFLRAVGLDVRNGTWLPSPGMVDEELRVDAEHPV